MMEASTYQTHEELLKSDILFMEKRIESHKKDTEHMEKEIEKAKAKLKEISWMNGSDEQHFDYIEVSSNWENWKESKNKFKKNKDAPVFYIAEDQESNWEGLKVSGAKELIKYLQHKIDYLESEDN